MPLHISQSRFAPLIPRAGRYSTSTRSLAPPLIRRPSGYETKSIGLVPRLVQSEYNNVRVTLRTARGLALTIYFAASSPQHSTMGILQVSYILSSRGVRPHPTNPSGYGPGLLHKMLVVAAMTFKVW